LAEKIDSEGGLTPLDVLKGVESEEEEELDVHDLV
jgi:hypothetical protein